MLNQEAINVDMKSNGRATLKRKAEADKNEKRKIYQTAYLD